ncbi:MAG: 30S ribosomal protein S21 [Mycoplasmataceae bacterium]|jgi:small subunit ribosomal protein S21|nr:30S ribosomal protein S21 [Mycoplasmataceae bacterium]
MPKIIVKDGELNEALKRFSRITSETRRIAKRHEFYLRPGLRAKEKSKEARKYQKKVRTSRP